MNSVAWICSVRHWPSLPTEQAAKILEDGLGTAERPLGEDDPVPMGELVEEILEADGLTQLVFEYEKGFPEGVIEGTEEGLFEKGREDLYLNEELRAGLDRVVTVDGSPP